MKRFVRKYLFWIVFLLERIFHKGLVVLFQKINISLEWNTIFSKEFFGSLLLTVLEFIIIGYTLLGCTEPFINKNDKIIRVISYFILGIILSISLFGILTHYEFINTYFVS